MQSRSRIFRTTLIILVSVIILLVVAGGIFSKYAHEKAESELKSLNAKISSLNINILTRSVTIRDLEWTHLDDSLSRLPHQLKLKNVRFSGISLYQLLLHKRIHINKIIIDGGSLQYNKTLKVKSEQSAKAESKLKGVTIDLIVLKNINTQFLHDSLPEYSGIVNLKLGDVGLTDIKKAKELTSYRVNFFESIITKIRLHKKGSMYTTSVAQLYLNSDDQKIIMDSIILKPMFSKFAFSRKVGRQLDRINASIPKVSITGLLFPQLKDSLFTASEMEITSAQLHVFRDKRLPFVKDTNMPLPMALIREFSFGIAIDTVKITDAKITYEEFPAEGFHTGAIYFDHLNASLDHISNRDYYSNYKQATLTTSARVMGKGAINVEFSLPYGEPQIYNAKGSISNLSLYRLNPILEDLAFISIESGTLNQLNFNFDYNDIVSKGSILINYENLKLLSLTKEKESSTNEFKSWVLNTVVKKDKNKTVDREKRTGTIYVERDRRKAIFNIWVKSLFSGLKSSVLDSSTKKEREK